MTAGSAWGACDTAACVILTIHWNLCIETIVSFSREDRRPLLDDLQNLAEQFDSDVL
jgi:hypothetical protein